MLEKKAEEQWRANNEKEERTKETKKKKTGETRLQDPEMVNLLEFRKSSRLLLRS